jgi:beta-lactamase regulating signal transducer with metallopeptidase domain
MILKVTLALAVSMLVALAARRAAAATRHAVLMAGLLIAMAMPFLGVALPRVEVQTVRRPMLSAALRAGDVGPALQPAPDRLESRSYILGVLIVAALRIVSYVRAWRVTRRAKPFADGILITGELRQPATFGRSILLPAEARAWTDQRLDAVLRHERAHLARGDQWAQLVAGAACAAYWLHPLAWLAARWAALERERACDDAVLAAGIDPAAYAATLLDVARHAVSFAPAMAERTHLGRRIESILDDDVARRPSRAGAVCAVAATILVTLPLAAITSAGEPDLLGDAIASPFSERLDAPIAFVDVPLAGRDAELIAILRHAASRAPRSRVDLVPERARWALARARNGAVIEPALEALSDPDWRIRTYAAWTLGVARTPRATEPLLRLLEEDNWRVRAMASTALAEIADPRAASAMRHALDDAAWQVRAEAVRYFAAIGRSADIMNMRNDRHIAVRVAAEEALQ